MEKTKIFTREEFEELGLPYGKLVIEEKIIDEQDYYNLYSLIFRLKDMPDNLAYKIYYKRNKSHQWEFEDNGKAYLVKYVTHTVTISEWVDYDEEISG